MSRNISKEKREKLLAKINELRNYLRNTNDSIEMIAYLTELEKELKRQKFGLVFEEHKEEIDEKLETHTPVLKEDKDLFINNGGQVNFLIEGDNLAALDLLNRTHKGKIDVIYIDPPYNTGSSTWVYNNNIIDSNDQFRHSKWLSFMKSRLELAKNLLSENGIICVTIDDYEIYTLGLLLDSIFGEENKAAIITVENNPRGRTANRFYATSHEYYLVYAKNIRFAQAHNLPLTEKQKAEFRFNDEISPYRIKPLRKSGADSRRKDRPKQFYPIYVNPTTLKGSLEKQDDYEKVLPIDDTGSERVWVIGIDKCQEYLQDGTIIITMRSTGKFSLSFKDRIKIGRKLRTVWVDPRYDTSSHGATLLLKMFGDKVFDYPKSLWAVHDYIYTAIGNKQNATILDFFAGSGTTGHAVLELNKLDKGNRKFILCTNNENAICRDVTYERLKTIITGKRKDGSEYGESIKTSLKYQKIEFLHTAEQTYYDYANELLKHIKELVELENAINFDGNTELEILLTEDEVEKFFKKTMKLSQVKIIYLGHDISLDLIQQKTLQNNNIVVNIIPEYYYKEKQV